jgi:hypothetical protein
MTPEIVRLTLLSYHSATLTVSTHWNKHINLQTGVDNCYNSCHKNPFLYCVAKQSAWPSGLGRAPYVMLRCTRVWRISRVQTPGADTVNQAVHPSAVCKLVAISMQWVTSVEDCEGKACMGLYVWWLACGLCSRRRKLPHVGFMQFARAPWKLCKLLKVPNKCMTLTFDHSWKAFRTKNSASSYHLKLDRLIQQTSISLFFSCMCTNQFGCILVL